jgi:hypothetical protein
VEYSSVCCDLVFFRVEANKEWVDFSHDGDCSFAGVYQPPLPVKNSSLNEFIATSNYADIFAFLKLKTRSSVSQIRDAAEKVSLLKSPLYTVYRYQCSVAHASTLGCSRFAHWTCNSFNNIMTVCQIQLVISTNLSSIVFDPSLYIRFFEMDMDFQTVTISRQSMF